MFYGDGGPVVVAGVTTGQGGRESRPQGEGGQVVGHRKNFTVDHDLSVRSRPDLVLSPGNFRPAHWRCNMSKGGYLDNEADLDLGEPSKDW